MAGVALVGKIRGRNLTQDEMEIWVQKNWMGSLQYEPETTPLAKGWFGFLFNCKDDAGKIFNQNWNYGLVLIILKKWTPCLMRTVKILI